MKNDNKFFLTLFTPTYNRAYLLPKLYESLQHQTNNNFIWMVIDDGSNDDTENLIKKYINEDKLHINYYKKSNGGKYTAYNMACQLVNTPLILIALDSDDYLKYDAVEIIYKDYCEYLKKSSDLVGLVYMCEDENGEIMRNRYDKQLEKNNSSLQYALINDLFYGEAEYVFKSNYIKNYTYPERSDEVFFNEAYTYIQMNGLMKWRDISIYIAQYRNDGITKNFLKTILKNPLNYADYSNMQAKYHKKTYRIIKYTFYYNVFSLLGNREKIINSSSHPIVSLICFPLSYIAYYYFSLKKL